MTFDHDILICGAGAAGLTLAIDLARRGVSFLLIDQNERPFGGSRGKGIQPRTLEVFEDLGVVDRLFAVGAPYPPLRHYHADGTHADSPIMVKAAATPAEPYPEPLMVAQFHTEAVLRERLSELGARPRFGRRLTGFAQDADGVTARIVGADGEQLIRVRYLIGCDGGRSFVRHALNIGFPGETLGVRALVADVELDGLDRSAWHRFRFGSAATQIMICPLAGTDLFQIQAPVPREGDIDLSPAALTAMVRERTQRTDIMVRSVSWASVYAMNARLADRYRVGRVFLAGDAAHVHPPTGGQGLNTSVQDAYNLGWKLGAVLDGADATLLDSYEAERRPIAAGMLDLSTRLLDAAKTGAMTRSRETHQLDLGYRGTALSIRDPAGRAHVQPGDRAPDAPCLGRGGQPARLFSLFAGPHWTLLGYAVPGSKPAARPGLIIRMIGADGDLVDADHHIADAYGISPGDWVLIRPDGYVAGIGEVVPDTFLDSYIRSSSPSAPRLRVASCAA